MGLFSSIRTSMDRLVPQALKGEIDSLRKGRLIVFSCITVILMSIAYSGLYIFLSHIPGVIICSYGALSAVVCIYLLNKDVNTDLAGNFFAASSFIFFAAFTLTTYGIETTISTWILIVPLSALLMVGIRSAVFWTAMALLLLTALYALQYFDVSLPSAFDRKYIPVVNYLALVGHLLFGFIAIIGNERVKNVALEELERTHWEVKEQQTELRRKNQEIVAVNRELEAKIEKRTQTLQLTNEELDTFLYESSHALRRPLVRILGLANIVQLAETDEERNAYLKNIEVTASGMDIMLQDLLKVSQVNNREIDKRPVRLHTLLSKFNRDLKEEYSYDAPEIKIELSRKWIIDTDHFMLKKVFEVVLTNAIQYKRDDQTRARIKISEQLNASGLHILIEDMGQGVHPRALPDIFKMFSKGTEKSKGSGLGLYIAQKAMSRIGGKIVAESEHGSWARIILSFPPYLVDEGEHPVPRINKNPEAIK